MDDDSKAVELLLAESVQIIYDLMDHGRILPLRCKEFFRAYSQIFSYIKEDGHGGKCLSVLYMINVSRILSDGKTHISC